MAELDVLKGQVAVVTGGGSGLGAAMAAEFGRAGMAVAVLDRDAESAAQVAASVASECDVATTSYRVDVGETSSVDAAAAHVRDTLGDAQVLCANVGVQQFGALDQLTDEEWQWVLNVNVLGSVRTVRAFLPLLRAGRGFRRVVFTASDSVLAPSVRMGAYQASKFAVFGIAETLRAELADEDIGVTVMFPAGMTTRHLESSASARPDDLATTGDLGADIDAMLAYRPLIDGDLISPQEAIRNLLTDLVDNQPYVVTHGSSRRHYAERRDALDAAYDRMEQS